MSEKVLLVKIEKPSGGLQRLSHSEPVGLCYLAAMLKKRGIDCQLLHLIQTSVEDDLRKAITDYQPTVVGFSVRNFNFNRSCDSIRLVHEVSPNARIAIGGECVTSDNAVRLAETADADMAVISDGEQAFVAYLEGVSPADIPGIAYRGSDGVHAMSASAARRVRPAELPMMEREGLPMEKYSTEAFPGKRYATIHAQRGCRYKCTFCHTARRYEDPLSRHVNQILDELDHLTTRYDVEALAIWDEDFFSDLNLLVILRK